MMPEFSEFSYGFAFTHEYINRFPGLTSAPELPSLIREAELGYDLKLNYSGHVEFFQFKLAEYMQRSNAIHWHHYSAPHYRVPIITRVDANRPRGTDQLSMLRRLAAKEKHVSYVAPKFHTAAEFNSRFSSREVTKCSLWIPVSSIPQVSGYDPHYLTFDTSRNSPLWHSEARKLEGQFTAEEHFESISQKSLIDEGYFRRLRANLIEAHGRSAETRETSSATNDDFVAVLKDTYRLLTAVFGLRMVTLIENDD